LRPSRTSAPAIAARPLAALALAAVAGALASGPARADSLASLPSPDYAAPSKNPQQSPLPERIRHLVYPTIGCPSLVAPGETIAPVVFLDDGGGAADWTARLESARDALVQTVRLTPQGRAYDAATRTYRLAFLVPAGTPEDTYDLVVESAALPGASGSDAQPNAVRVWKERLDYDFVHVADAQIRDPNTRLPQKWEQLLSEIKLRDPAFTLFSGDLNFGADYTREYEENHDILRRAAVPLVCVPGNHDGYGWLLSASSALYDGLHMWRRTIGPTDFSLRFGRQRFIALNSFGGPLERRNSYTFMTHNSGGHVEAPELSWLEGEARAATLAGDEAVVFMHHNPHPTKGLKASVPGYPWSLSLVGAASSTWNGAASRAEITRILGAHEGLSWVLAGHTNNDEHRIDALGAGASAHDVHYVNTTSPCNGGNPREGYRYVRVRGGRIAEIDYQPAQPSVPFPLGGNLAVTHLDANDGTQGRVRARVSNVLQQPVDVTLKVFLRPDMRGYVASVGRVRDVGLSDTGAFVAYVRVTVPAQGSVETEVAPALAGGGVTPAAISGGGAASGAGSGGSGGGGGCVASTRAGDPTAALPTWAMLALTLVGLATTAAVRRS